METARNSSAGARQCTIVIVKLSSLLARLSKSPLIASVQATDRSPVDHPDTLMRLAKASVAEGVQILRLEGVKNIRTIKPEVRAPIIGLLKRKYPKIDVYITPTAQDAQSLVDLGCDVIALDGTQRPRPFGQTFAGLVEKIHRSEVLVMADCDTLEDALAAEAAGADIIGTTLAGYTAERAQTVGPDLELLRAICKAVKAPVIAEGRFTERWQIEAALRIGAVAVTVGGALNDPNKRTQALMPVNRVGQGLVGAVDIGGTWLRFSTFSDAWEMVDSVHTPNPPTREERLAWIRTQVEHFKVKRVGVSTGGIVEPRTGEVVAAKEYLMHDHVGIVFSEETLGVPVNAFGDGHASAWAHANLPQFAGMRVATLALGTGVGCGFVQKGKIWAGPRGEYPTVNDLPSKTGETYEKMMGGLFLGKDLTEEGKASARNAFDGAIATLRGLYFPDQIVVCGGVGMSDWMAPELERANAVASPFGENAGLYGAAALALFPDYL
jgi:putative N-acetylmannosamine-6-phosphate epimerase/predicted NBD/HSP70 family sugar kinase